MISKLAVTLAYLSSLSLAVVIVDTKLFDEPGFQKVQQRNTAKRCGKNEQYERGTHTCIPKQK